MYRYSERERVERLVNQSINQFRFAVGITRKMMYVHDEHDCTSVAHTNPTYVPTTTTPAVPKSEILRYVSGF